MLSLSVWLQSNSQMGNMKHFWNGFEKKAERVDILDALSRESNYAQAEVENNKKRRESQRVMISPKQMSEDHGPDAYHGIEGL